MEVLKRTEKMIKRYIEELPDNTTLVIFTDHGRGEFRDHGGSSDAETHIMFSMFNKDAKFRIDEETDHFQTKLESFSQVSVAATVSTLFQTNFPFNNVGPIRPEYLVYNNDTSEFDMRVDMLKTIIRNELQISDYIHFYLKSDDVGNPDVEKIMKKYIKDYDNHKKDLFAILAKIKAMKGSKSVNETAHSMLFEDIDEYRETSYNRISQFSRNLNIVWSIPNIDYKHVLMFIGFFMVVFYCLFVNTITLAENINYTYEGWTYIIYPESWKEKDDPEEAKAKVPLKSRYIAVLIELICFGIFFQNTQILCVISFINLWILYPFIFLVFGSIKGLIQELISSDIVRTFICFVIIVVCPWALNIFNHQWNISYMICKLLMVIMIIDHVKNQKMFRAIAIAIP